jgi:hypothetical protein
MTEINGLRLAYRGFVAGLAGGYVWVAISMTLAAILLGDPLHPLQPLALAISPLGAEPELAFVLGFATIQIIGAFVGMCFAYFLGRFFTVRPTVALAAPAFAVLTWAALADGLARLELLPHMAGEPILLLATLGYGLLLGASVPPRPDILRQPTAG